LALEVPAMLALTIRKSFWFAILLLHIVAGASAQRGEPDSRMIVSVYNYANMPGDALASAETVAGRIFGEAGLNVKWMNCAALGIEAPASPCAETVFPTHLQVRILTRARNLPSSTFGIAFLSTEGSGCYSDVFLEPIAHLRATSGQEVASVLGHVMAHEIAHLLLGTNSHSPNGIMRGQWQRKELLSASMGKLLFTPQQSEVMRRRLSSVARQTVGTSEASWPQNSRSRQFLL
jgi:hypothetical protein